MKPETIKSLDELSSILADAFVADAVAGHTTRDDVEKLVEKIEHPTEIEVMKAMIRADRDMIELGAKGLGWRGRLSNVLKRKQYVNYVANEVTARLKEKARSGLFGPVYADIFSVRPTARSKAWSGPYADRLVRRFGAAKFVQPELPL